MLLAYHAFSAFFISSFDSFLYFCIFDIFPNLLFWQLWVALYLFDIFDSLLDSLEFVIQFGLCSLIWTLHHAVWDLNYAVWQFWLVHSLYLCIQSLANKYSSLFVNREKSRDLQRGLTDPSQLPLMMNFIFICLFYLFICYWLYFFCHLQIKKWMEHWSKAWQTKNWRLEKCLG